MMFTLEYTNGTTVMIFCTDGEFHAARFVGPGGFCAKTWKTQRGVARMAAQLGRGQAVAQ